MIEIRTKRLIGVSDMEVVSGKLNTIKQIERNNVINLTNLKSTTGKESGFLFYDKEDTSVLICHIGITWVRGKFEVSYGTEEQFRHLGYMQEALSQLVSWIFSNTTENEIWGLPNGSESEHILKTCGFSYYGAVENIASMKWYRIENTSMGD